MELIKLLSDFGLVVLIVMVQAIVYPSFKFYNKKNLIQWHRLYTKRLAIIVIPLMFAQLILSVILLSTNFSSHNILNGLLVIAVWASTFIQFVPIHNRIASESHTDLDLKLLVRRNWLRVALWMGIFVLSLLNYI